jgi:hypothetical protein
MAELNFWAPPMHVFFFWVGPIDMNLTGMDSLYVECTSILQSPSRHLRYNIFNSDTPSRDSRPMKLVLSAAVQK